MDKQQLVDTFASLRGQVVSLLRGQHTSMEQYEKNAFQRIIEHLDIMEEECRSNNLRNREQRFGYITRLVEETDPDLLPLDIGGALIKAENAYRDL